MNVPLLLLKQVTLNYCDDSNMPYLAFRHSAVDILILKILRHLNRVKEQNCIMYQSDQHIEEIF